MIRIISNTDLTPLRALCREEIIFSNEKEAFDQPELAGYNWYGASAEVNKILLFISGLELLSGYYYRLPGEELGFHVLSRLEGLFGKLDRFLSNYPQNITVMNTIVFPPTSFLKQMSTNSGPGLAELEYLVNKKIHAFAAARPNLLIMDWQKIVNHYGFSCLLETEDYGPGGGLLSPFAMDIIKKEFFILINTCRAGMKRILILNLDRRINGALDTMPRYIPVGRETGQGTVPLDLRKAVLSLRNLGVMLILVSKYSVLEIELLRQTSMQFEFDSGDFDVVISNPLGCLEGFRELKRDFNFDPHQIVFCSDCGACREEIRTQYPQISLPEFPPNPLPLHDWFLDQVVNPYFSCLHFPKEMSVESAVGLI